MTTFTARTDRSLVRANARSTRYVLLQATAPKSRTRRAEEARLGRSSRWRAW
jgi:hypothetical protein